MSDPNETIKNKKIVNSVMAGGIMAIFPLIFSILPGIGASVVKKAFQKYMSSTPCLCNQQMTQKKLDNYMYINEQEEFKKKLSAMRLALGGPWRFPSLPKVSKKAENEKNATDDVKSDDTAEGGKTEQQKTETTETKTSEPKDPDMQGGAKRPQAHGEEAPVLIGYDVTERNVQRR